MADDTIQTISIGLGLKLDDLRKQAQAAQSALNEAIKQDRLVTVKVRLGDVPINQINQVATKIGGLLDKALEKKVELNPKFSTTTARKTIEGQFGKTPVRVPLELGKVTSGQITTARKTIEGQWAQTPVRVPFSWYWASGPKGWDKEPPKGGSVPFTGGGGGDTGGGRGASRGGGAGAGAGANTGAGAAAAVAQTHAERSAANKAVHAAQREKDMAARQAAKEKGAVASEQAATNVGKKAASSRVTPTPTDTKQQPTKAAPAPLTTPARSRTRAPAGTTPGVALAPTQERPRIGNEGYTDRRGRMDREGVTYTPADLLAQEAERANGTFGRPPQERGTRGARLAGERPLTAAERRAREQLKTPEVQARMAIHRQRAAEITDSLKLRRSVALKTGQVVAPGGRGMIGIEKALATAKSSGAPKEKVEELEQLLYQSRAHKRAQGIVGALKDVPYNEEGIPQLQDVFSSLSGAFGPDVAEPMTTAWGAMLLGDYRIAGQQGKKARDAFVPLGTVRQGKRKLRRAADPSRGNAEQSPSDVLLFDALAGAAMGEGSIARNRNARNLKGTRLGRGLGPTQYSHGAGQIQAAAGQGSPEGQKYLETIRKAVPFLVGKFDPAAPGAEVQGWGETTGSEVEPWTMESASDPERGEVRTWTHTGDARPRTRRPRVEERRQKRREDTAKVRARSHATAEGLDPKMFGKVRLPNKSVVDATSPEGKAYLDSSTPRAEGGKVNRFDLDVLRASGKSAKSILGGSPESPLLAAGGALEWLLKRTLDESGAIKPGMEERSQLLNQLIEKKRGGWPGKAHGGRTPKGMYKVGERGEEMFVPEQDGWIIPHHLMDQLPKRELGGGVAPHVSYGRGPGGRFQSQAQASQAAIQSRTAGPYIGNATMHVFVTNWPTAATTDTAPSFAPAGRTRAPRAKTPTAATTTTTTTTTAGAGIPGAGTTIAGAGAGAGAAGAAAVVPGAAGLPGNRNVQTKQFAKSMARDANADLVDRLTQARTNVSEAMQQSPVRALSVAFGQIAQQAIGGRGAIIQRRDVANTQINRAQREVGFLENQRESLFGMRRQLTEARAGRGLGNRDPATVISELTQGIHENVAAQRAQKPRTEAAVGAAETASKGILNKGQIVRAQAVGLLGITGGTLAFSAAMQLAQFGIEEIGKVAGDAADRLTGFAMTAVKVTAEMAQVIQQQPGHPQAAAAARFAQLGLSPEAAAKLAPATRQGTLMAGAQNLQSVRDLQRTADLYSGLGMRGAIPGLGEGFGNGILPGTPLSFINQQQGIGELLTGRLGDMMRVSSAPSTTAGYNPTAYGIAPSTPGRYDPNWMTSRGGGNPQPPAITPGQYDPNWATTSGHAPPVVPTGPSTQVVNYLKDLSETSRKGLGLQGAGLKLVQTDDADLLKATKEAFAAAKAGPLGEQLAAAGFGLQAPNGQKPTDISANMWMQGVAQGQLAPNVAESFDAMRPQMAQAIAGIQLGGQYQRGTSIPVALAMQLRQNPLLPPTTGMIGSTGLSPGFTIPGSHGINNEQPTTTFGPAVNPIPGIAESTSQSLQNVTTTVGGVQDAMKAAAQAGEEWLSKLSPEAQQAIGAMTALGSQISAITAAEQRMQAEFQTEQMNRQSELQVRHLGDILGLTGKQSETLRIVTGFNDQGVAQYGTMVVKATQLGKLQHDQLMLSRETQTIEFAKQQRQINFSLAMAQVGVPGASAAERAVALADARLKAQEDQQALDRQKKMFDLMVSMQDITINLDLTDANKQMAEFTKGNQITIKTGELEKTKTAMEGWMSTLSTFAGSFVSDQQQIDKVVSDAALASEAQLTGFEVAFKKTIDESLAYLSTQYGGLIKIAGFDVGTGTSTTPTPNPTPPTDQNEHTPVAPTPAAPEWTSHATGAWSTGNEFARLHVGEMVLPASIATGVRQMLGATVSSASGGGTVNINIINPVVRNDSDIDAIARKVEQVMNRRALAIGLNS